MTNIIAIIKASLFAAVAAHIWSFYFDVSFDFVYAVLGLPLKPTMTFWVVTLSISVIFGFLGGVPALLFSGQKAILELRVYTVACIVWLLAIGLWLGGSEGMLRLLKTKGFWSFLVGALLALAIAQRVHALTTRSRPTPQATPEPRP